MKACPFCAEEIQDEAVKCKHCGSDLVPAPQPGSSTAAAALQSDDTPAPPKSSKNLVIAIAVGVVVVLGVGAFMATKSGNDAREDAKAAQSVLRNGLVVAKIIYTDYDSYSNLSTSEMSEVEPSLTFSMGGPASYGTVSVRDVEDQSVLLVTKSPKGSVFCIVDDAEAGTSYGTTDAQSASECVGGW